MFVFKLALGLLAAYIAKALGEPPAIGLMIGVFFGHIFDVILSKKLYEWQYRSRYLRAAKERANADFLFCFFTLAGKVCTSDDNICELEKKKIAEIIRERLNLGRKDRKTALKYFEATAKQNVVPQTLAVRLLELCQNTPDMMKNTILLLRELAECDGKLNKAEKDILYTLSSVFGFDHETSNFLIMGQTSKSVHGSQNNNKKTSQQNGSVSPESSNLDHLNKHLKILECSPKDSNERIKQKYRELVAKFHPDKIQSKDLPQDFIDFAKGRFTEIRGAYEEVRRLKGF